MNKNTNAALYRNWAVDPVPTADSFCINRTVYSMHIQTKNA